MNMNQQKISLRVVLYGALVGAGIAIFLPGVSFWTGLILGAVVGGVLSWHQRNGRRT